MVLSLLVVWVKMYRFLLTVVVRVGCCYCDSLEVLIQEKQVVWDAALVTRVSLLGRCLCGAVGPVGLGANPHLWVMGCYLGS